MSESLKGKVKPRSTTVMAAAVGTILTVGMALAVAATIIFAWIADEVLEGDSLAFDTAVRDRIHCFATESLTASMQFFSFLGSTVFLSAATILLIALFLSKRQKRSAVLMAVIMAGAIVLNYVLKINFQRTRPLPYFETPLPASFSFPSGHSLFSACFFGIAAWLIAPHLEHLAAKASGWASSAIIVLLVGISRVYLGVHFPTDVIAGFLAAIIWILAVISADSYLKVRGS